MILPAFQPVSTWQLPKMSELPSWRNAKRIAIDIETRDPLLKELGIGVRRDGKVIGVSFAIEDGPACYLPMGHLTGPNLDRDLVLRYLSEQASAFRGDVVGANLQYDLDYLAEEKVEFWHCRWLDVQVMEPLLNELRMSYSLDNIAGYHNMPGKDEEMLRKAAAAWGVDPKAGLWMLPSQFVGAYAERDARLPLQLLRRQEREIEKQELNDIRDLECRLQPVLLKMRRRGVAVSFDRLDQVETWAMSKEAEALHEIGRQTGIKLTVADTTKTSALVPVIHHLGIKIPKSATGKDSLTKDYLESLKHPVADMLRTARKYNKLRTTFVKSVRTHAVKGRVHCTFNQVRIQRDGEDDGEGARYGRLSCVDPNLQQQPARDPDIGKKWRSIYMPDEGGIWAANDYSQQEPRWLTHYAELMKLPRAFEAAERYRNDPNTDNHQMMADLCQIDRKPAKEIFLGLCYGMGGAKLCRKLGLPTEWRVKVDQEWLPVDHPEAVAALIAQKSRRSEVAGPAGRALLEKFDDGAPYVKMLAKKVEARAAKMGFIVTAAGRRCRFPVLPDGKVDWAHKGLNRLIQGSSGDQTKKAMVDADAAGIPLQLQVHDELDLTVARKEDALALAEIMKAALPCRVPAKVDTEIGPSWGEAK